MSDLEKYMMENRDRLTNDEPSPDHMSKFEAQLGLRISSHRLDFKEMLRFVALVAVILASGIVIVKTSNGSGKMAAAEPATEFKETTQYFAAQVNERYDEISAFQIGSSEEKQILLDELSEMDTYYKELLSELDANPGDERVMSAMIQHYRLKLSIMDQIIDQLIQIKNTNNEDNENANI